MCDEDVDVTMRMMVARDEKHGDGSVQGCVRVKRRLAWMTIRVDPGPAREKQK